MQKKLEEKEREARRETSRTKMETSQEAIGLGPRQNMETSEETTNKRYSPAEYENGIKLQQRHNEIMRKREAPLRTNQKQANRAKTLD